LKSASGPATVRGPRNRLAALIAILAIGLSATTLIRALCAGKPAETSL